MIKTLKFKVFEGGKPPEKKHESDSCYDLSARKVAINNDGWVIVQLGIALDIPVGYDVRLYPRSSLSKTGWVLGNSVGVIDQEYTGELSAIFWPVSVSPSNGIFFPYKVGDRCIQMEMRKKLTYNLQEVEEIESTVRGEGGFGSTGK